MANVVITDKIKSSATAASLDAKYGPYASTTAANAALGENGDDVITAGLTVGITQSDGSVKEFWYQPDGQGGLQLVEKQVAGGTDDYADLDNKPQINSVTLSGNKSASDLGLATAAQGENADTAIQGVQVNGSDLTLDANKKVNILPMTGATSSSAGSAGLVPAPTAGDDEKILQGDGTWVTKPTNGKSAYDIWYEENGYSDPTTYNEEYFLATLKANIGAFKFVDYDGSAESAFTTGGIGTAYNSTIDGLTAGTDTDETIILLMNNTDGTTDPTKTFMIATQETSTPGTYEFIYAGDLQSAMPSNVLTQTNIINNFITGGATNVASAEIVKTLGEEVFNSVETELTRESIVNCMYYDTKFISTPQLQSPSIYVFNIQHNGVLNVSGTSTNENRRVFVVGTVASVNDIVVDGTCNVLNNGMVGGSAESPIDFNCNVNVNQGDIVIVSGNYTYCVPSVTLITQEGNIEKLSEDVESLQDDVENLQDDVENLQDDVIHYNQTANLHNSLPAFVGDEYTATDGRDWYGHNLTGDSTNYNSTQKIEIDSSKSYKHLGVKIRRIVCYDSSDVQLSSDSDSSLNMIDPNTEIVFSDKTYANQIAYIRFMYSNSNSITPAQVKFGLYTDDIDVDYDKFPCDKNGKRIVTEDLLNSKISDFVTEEEIEELLLSLMDEKVVTSVASSGFANMAGGQYCLTQTQKDTYGITNGLTVTKVLQVLLGYDIANVCAYSGFTPSAIFFANGCAGYILKNAVTLKADGTDTTYQWDTSSIEAQMTSNLSLIKPGSIGTFNGTLNGIAVRVSVRDDSTHTIKPIETLPFDITIPAGSMLLRSPYTSSNTGEGTITKGLKGTTGLIMQIGANSEGATPEEIFNYCELAIKESGCKWFVVLRQNTQGDLDYSTSATTGTSDLNKAAGMLRAKYGSRFIDHMAYMTSLQALIDQGITPTTDATYTYNGSNNNDIANYTMPSHLSDIPSDMKCIATRRVPSSFWYGAWRITDEVAKNEGHFNAQGLECLGKYLYKMIQLLKIE